MPYVGHAASSSRPCRSSRSSLEKIGDLPKRKYAVIVDEAHSSQIGRDGNETRRACWPGTESRSREGEGRSRGDDPEEEILKAMRNAVGSPTSASSPSRPRPSTRPWKSSDAWAGREAAIHSTSTRMRQAIEEGFILDVLENYTTYKTYYRLIKSIEDDPKFTGRRPPGLGPLHEPAPAQLAQKTEVMVEHFRTFTRHKIGGRAKAMVVTSSRLHAVRYKQAFDKYLKEKGYTTSGPGGVLRRR